MYILQSVHGQSLLSEKTKFQILGPKYDNYQYHIAQFLHYMSENVRL